MPEPIQPEYQIYTPAGVVDSIDGNTTKQGAMSLLSNLIPDPETAGFYVCRSAAYALTSFAGFSSPGYVSVQTNIGTLEIGMIASSRNPGNDEPYVLNRTTGTFLTISGITAANTPTSPATTGAWSPPVISSVGGWTLFTHPGFNKTNGYYGWLDMTGFSLGTLTGNLNSTTAISTLSANPLVAGVTVGMTISGLGIPSNTTITAVTGSGSTGTLTISQAATLSTSTVTFIIAGGTTSAPLWASGNTNGNPLPSVPQGVAIFNDRAYFECGNVEYYTDVLNPLNMSNATNSLTLGGNDAITASVGQPFFATQTGGITAALLCFKGSQIWQITGDLALNNLALNKLSDGVGTQARRSVVNTPTGVMFVAPDGIRTVDLTGQVTEADSDLTLPFLNPIVPSRIAAAYNVGFYRICTNYLQGGVLETAEFWYSTKRKNWCGPHTLTYDCIAGADSTFYVSGPNYTGQILQTNVIPNEQTDFFNEMGQSMTWEYQTALIPEFRAMPGWALIESSIFLEFQLQQTITASVLDQSFNILGTYALKTLFLAPSNATNWQLKFTSGAGAGGTVMIPTRHMFQLKGTSSMNLGLGSIFAHYQYQSDDNAYDVDDPQFTLPSIIDFGSVTDPILNYNLDWGGVSDAVLATVDFESIGSIVPGPP